MSKKDEKKQVFDYMDKNEKGTISKNDLALAIRYLGIIKSQNDFNFLLKSVDEEINFDQFSEIVTKCKSTEIKGSDLDQAFELFDDEKNQKIPVDEFFHVLSVAGEKLSPEDVKLFKEYAKISDGSSSFNYKNAINNMIGELKTG
ncbi:MAG: hypothetical protein MJ252_02305 [archaeon]|nr:hypothetical protein [archaeon]